MSSRLARTLLKLYPRRIQDRYGDELLALDDELSAQGERSRTRLIRDMLAGALLVRPTRDRSGLVIGAVCLVAAVAVAAVIIGTRSIDVSAGKSHPPARAAAQAHRVQHRHGPKVVDSLPAVAIPHTGCFVGAGSSCSLTPCSEFTDASPTKQTATRDGVSISHRGRGASATRCTAYPRVHPQRTILVDG
jgi:hypothetical protein